MSSTAVSYAQSIPSSEQDYTSMFSPSSDGSSSLEQEIQQMIKSLNDVFKKILSELDSGQGQPSLSSGSQPTSGGTGHVNRDDATLTSGGTGYVNGDDATPTSGGTGWVGAKESHHGHGTCCLDDTGKRHGNGDDIGNGNDIGNGGVWSETSPSTVSFNAGPNPKIEKWAPDIQKAAKLSGIDPDVIGGQMWAESRGDSGSDINSKNIDGTTDLSLMQISQERWNRDVLPTLSAQDKETIKKATGKDASQLDMSNPHDNVIGGAFELRMHIVDSGGDVNNPMANHKALVGGLKAYVGVGDESKYANNVLTNANVLKNGKTLDDNQ